MHTLGRFHSAQRSMEGELILSFCVADVDISDIQEGELVIDAEKYSEKRSLNANAYFWKLCTLIGNTLGSSKDTVYLLQLQKYGQFIDLTIKSALFGRLEGLYRYVEKMEEGDEWTEARCYIGSSHYSKAEMRVLIDGTVNDAHDLGISTWSDEEVERLINAWKPK